MGKQLTHKIIAMVTMLFITVTISAVPAREDLWRVITLSTGEKINARLQGDEHISFLADKDGNVYLDNGDGTYRKTTFDAYAELIGYKERVEEVNNIRRDKRNKVLTLKIRDDKSVFQGVKKGLVILVEFQDVKFSDEYDFFDVNSVKELYNRILNERNLDEPPFKGSVKDYFIDQSRGQFELDFDVVGPYTLENTVDFYGSGVYTKAFATYALVDNDAHAGRMAYEAVQAAYADGVDFSKYDWDGDGEVDQVYIIYAGQGEADGGAEYTIWPHADALSTARTREYNRATSSTTYYTKDKSGNYTVFERQPITTPTYNGVKIDTYACSNELSTNSSHTQLAGIGTLCHEFSHCMGFADHYDIRNGNNFTTWRWDVMSHGNYNGSWNGGNPSWSNIRAGFCPAGYTAFERWSAGWLEPRVLDDPVVVKELRPIGGVEGDVNDAGGAYVIYCRGNDIKGEYYLLENRQQANWDKELPWHGLLITHVDYDTDAWVSKKTNTSATGYHYRYYALQASGTDPCIVGLHTYPYNPDDLLQLYTGRGRTGAAVATSLNNSYKSSGMSLKTVVNNSLTSSTTPAMTYYNGTETASEFTGHDIKNIKQNTDAKGTIYFEYGNPDLTGIKGVEVSDEDVFDGAIYNLNGQRVGNANSNDNLSKGVYIVNGKKVVR